MMAELWGAAIGLSMAVDLLLPRVVLEMDSKIAVQFILEGVQPGHPCSTLVKFIQQLIAQDWEVRVLHVFREANRCADQLANHGQMLATQGVTFFSTVPPFLSLAFSADSSSTKFTRLVGF